MASISFTRKILFELVDKGDLSGQEQMAVEEALREQSRGVNRKFQVGAVAVGCDGTMASVRNDTPGPDWHAEQRALCNLYAKSKVRRLKLIAMAGARPGEEVIQYGHKPYQEGMLFDDVCWAKPCGKCLEFIHDCTANVSDVGILSVAKTGQVVRTTLRSLITAPHTSLRVPVECVGNAWHPVPSTAHNKDDKYG